MEIKPNVLSLSDFERQTARLDMKTNDTADAVLCIAGDWAPIRAYAPLIETDPEAVYGDLLPLLRSADPAAVNPQAWMETSFAYWEGPVRIEGSHAGRGYLEMTGYAPD